MVNHNAARRIARLERRRRGPEWKRRCPDCGGAVHRTVFVNAHRGETFESVVGCETCLRLRRQHRSPVGAVDYIEVRVQGEEAYTPERWAYLQENFRFGD